MQMDGPNNPSDYHGEHTQASGTPDAAADAAPSSSPTNITLDQTAAAAAAGSSPTKHDVAEVPKWRFSNIAKKSLGYSSAAAGKVVEGETSQEIVSRYVVPKNSSIIQEESGHEYASREIGRQNINAGGDEVTESFEMAGKLSIPKDLGGGTPNEVSPKSSQQQENQQAKIDRLVLAMNKIKQKHGDSNDDTDVPTRVDLDATCSNSEEPEAEQPKVETESASAASPPYDDEYINDAKEEGKTKTAAKHVQEQIPSLPVPPSRVDLDATFSEESAAAAAAAPPSEDELDQLEKQEKEKVEDATEDNIPSHRVQPDPIETEDKVPEEEESKLPWKKFLIISAIIFVSTFIVGVVVGVVIGGKDEEGETNENQLPQEGDSTTIPTTIAPGSSGKLKATFPPTIAPSAACAESTEKLFSVSSKQNEQVEFLSSFGWVVTDVCTGEEVMKCLPCSSVAEDGKTVTASSTLPRGYRLTADGNVRHRLLEGNDDRVKQCVPDRKYMFEIESPSSGECCGFDPTNFVVYYDGKVVRKSDWLLKMKLNPMIQDIAQQSGRQADNNATVNEDLSQAFTVETQTYFGAEDDDGPCPSASPSTSPAPTSPPKLDFALPEGADPISSLPCQEVMEAEMLGRINGLNCAFCGFCSWKQSDFSCYQRIAHLKRVSGIGEIEGRQALCDRDECSPPPEDTPFNDWVWSEIQKSDQCEPSFVPTKSHQLSTSLVLKADSIEGLGSRDRFGAALSFSSDSNLLAIGALQNSGRGYVNVYRYDIKTTAFTQLGESIDGSEAGNNFGTSVLFSPNENLLAIGAVQNGGGGPGYVNVYTFDEEKATFAQFGDTLVGNTNGDQFGASLSFSPEANLLAVGAVQCGNNGPGYVNLYRLDDNTSTFVKLGETLVGSGDDDFGNSLEFSHRSNMLAIGASQLVNNGPGYANVYKVDQATSSLTQLGDSIKGFNDRDRFGYSLAFSPDSSMLAVGAYQRGNDGPGYVHVYKVDGAALTFTQLGDALIGGRDGDSFGASLSFSPNVNLLAVGAYQRGNGGPGYVNVYRVDEAASTFTQLGDTLVGDEDEDEFGTDLSFSPSFGLLAIGAAQFDTSGAGYANVYHLE